MAVLAWVYPIRLPGLDISGVGGIRVSTTNPGSGTADWIAGNYGATTGDRVVMGNLLAKQPLVHNNTLTAWAR